MCKVRDLVKKNEARPIPTISPKATVLDALRDLARLNIGALLVVEKDKILGIFSERDYARKVLLEGRQSDSTPVGEVMSRQVLFVSPENTLEECMIIMSEKSVKHLPVIEGNQLVDFISMKDVVDGVVDDKDFMIDQLTCYITGSQSVKRLPGRSFAPVELNTRVSFSLTKCVSL